ncbi:uncharacterized protein LOC133815081 [Humulus lupulus]|uniref:uncharacterized protein LOC133815081 n=1 Tax=Humulus lupulus TaxID=3486 RepID=UPI002B413D05|nr:uncharacterized protein LOC133815081 [Humulus lupulus]
MAEVAEQAQNWNSAVICMVLGANPPFVVFEGFVKRIWRRLGIERVVQMNMGLTIVKFNDEVTRDFMLETGIVKFDKKPVIVRPWSQDSDTVRLVRLVPLWIRLPNLGLQYWGQKCLSALVITIGKPIMVDKFTKERSMVRFARVLVEMEISDDPPFVIYFVNEKGQVQEQYVEYEWLPIKCSNCKGYGHNMAECKNQGPKTWAKKNVTEKKTVGVNAGTEIQMAAAISTVSAGETMVTKETREKQDVAGTETQKEIKEGGSTQGNLLTLEHDNKENWEVPKRVGNLKSIGKLVMTDKGKR